MARNRKRKIKDPQAERESRKYEHPIPSREAIIALLNDRGELMKQDHIATALQLHEERDLEALRRRLNAMVKDAQLIKNRRGGYGIARKLDLVPGRVIGHPDGYGFVTPDAGGEDFYLNPRQMRRVLNDDRVLVSLTGIDGRGRKEGSIVEILERGNSHVVGRFHRESGIAYVVSDERRIHLEFLIPPGDDGGAEPGDYVYIEIVDQPEVRRQPVGRVLDVLGRTVNAPMAVEIAIRSYNLPTEWPEAVKKVMERVPDHVRDEDLSGRKDLREVPLVTIDGADAKDFDDAIFAKPRKDGGWELLVAIADVSHYVRPGAPLDVEAQERGTSAYFPNRVVPMLPEALSNGICSLKPKVDRLCLVCEIQFDGKAKVQRSRFYPAVMHSHARLTYDQVWTHVTEPEKGPQLDDPVKDSIRHLYDLYHALRARRDRRGAIDFDSQEVAFRFDELGQVSDIVPRTRNDAHKLIEECMIAANVEAALWLQRKKIPAPFRVHARPPERKLDDLRQSLSDLGFFVPDRDRVKPEVFSRILASVQDRPEKALVEALVLRAQSLAVYQTENEGHFGLALEAYTHFTSPIRRYPDLLVHRAIRHGVEKSGKGPFRYDGDEMERLCSHCSVTERRATEAGRDVDERLKCAYMEAHLMSEFDGVITGVTSFGVFVQLVGLNTDGLVHVTMLPNDYYHFDAISHTLTGEKRRQVYRLADRVRVQVIRVDVDERQIDLKMVEEE